jgi:streptogramin lyase
MSLFLLLLVSSQSIFVPTNMTFGLAQDSASPIIEHAIPQNASYPLGVTMDSKGNVWFSEAMKQSISVFFVGNQTFKTFRLPTNTTGLTMIWFLFFDRDGYLWFADQDQPLLWRFNPMTDSFANFSTGNNLVRPFALAYNQNTDQVWFTSTYTNQIGVFQIGQAEVATLLGLVNLPSIGSENSGPAGIAFASSDLLVIGQPFTSTIAEYDISSQKFVHVWQLPLGSQPVGVAPDLQRNVVWFTDHAASLFGFVNESTGKVTEYSTSLFHYTQQNGDVIQSITLPYWIQLSSDGMVWFDQHYSNKMARFDPQTNTLTEFLVPTQSSANQTTGYSSEPLRFYIDNQRGMLWFTEFSGNKLSQLPTNSSMHQNSFLLNSTLKITGRSENLVANTSSSSFNSSSISGTLTSIGNLASNFSIAISSVTPNNTKFAIQPTQVRDGNYTLTICKVDPSQSSLYVEQCSIVYLEVSSASGLESLPSVWIYVIAAGVVVAAGLISLFIIRRWRT